MSLLQLVNQIDVDKFEEEARDEFYTRKDAISKMGNWSKKLALSAIPLGALAAFSEPALAQSNGEPLSTLKFALTLEYLEATFYNKAQDSGVYNQYSATFDEITKNENSHVNFLQAALSKAGAEVPQKPDFDFTLGGAYQPFEKTAQFLIFSQAFEDLGVRAYKGQAGDLLGTPYLTKALRIHSVEARHASAVRRVRKLQGWIPGIQNDIVDDFQSVYEGDPTENNVTQLGINVDDITPKVGRTSVTEAWDEPLNHDYVFNIAKLFIV